MDSDLLQMALMFALRFLAEIKASDPKSEEKRLLAESGVDGILAELESLGQHMPTNIEHIPRPTLWRHLQALQYTHTELLRVGIAEEDTDESPEQLFIRLGEEYLVKYIRENFAQQKDIEEMILSVIAA